MLIKYENGGGVTKRMANIPDGVTFTGRIGHYPARLFLRAGGECPVIVALDYTNNTWSGYPELEIEDYKEVTVTIHVRE